MKIGRSGVGAKDSERYPGGPGFEPDTQQVFNLGPAYIQGTGHTRERQRKEPGGKNPQTFNFLFPNLNKRTRKCNNDFMH